MQPSNGVFIQLVKRCQKSPSFFVDNFCKVKHPMQGIIAFKLYSYQRKALAQFKKHRFNVFKKCRQCGASTLTGVYALWFAMMFAQKSILIVSKRDEDAMEFLNRNVKFVYDNLPDWMQKIWKLEKRNEHEMVFANGSTIRSLTSSPDTLRSNSASLIIVDEAAFMPAMETMWSGGWSTIQTGGSVIVISTTNGLGNWYWKTWNDAINKDNDFNPIQIEWWDMDWVCEFTDEISGAVTRIAPTDGLRKCETPKEIERYGPYWSPWLEDQHRQLATKGNDQKFRQEILAEFMGTGNTVLNREALLAIQEMVMDTEEAIKSERLKLHTIGIVDYVNTPANEVSKLDFQEDLLIWKPPYNQKVLAQLSRKNVDLNSLPPHDRRPHRYVIGADSSSGEANDFCAVEVLDIDTNEQVAELRIRALPRVFARMVDYIGRWYNNAFIVPERTGIGAAVCQELDKVLMYPNLYRHKKVQATLKLKYLQIGYPTSSSSKPILVKYLQDELGVDGLHIKSSRLYHELSIFIHLGKNKFGNEQGSGNTDDLVLAMALALVGIEDALYRENLNLTPVHSMEFGGIPDPLLAANVGEMTKRGGRGVLIPYGMTSEIYTDKPSAESELARFATQIGGVPISKDKIPRMGTNDPVSFKKHILRYFKH